MTIFGWDASHYDWTRGPMDLVAAKAAGISFMTHKIGEGSDYTDPKFAAFYTRAKAAHIPLLGAYYVNHNGNQNAQADRFLKLLDEQAHGWRDGPFLLQIDSERWPDGTPTPAEVEAFAHRLLAEVPSHVPMIYGPKWVYGDMLRGAGVPLWASNYGANPLAAFHNAYPGDRSAAWGAYSGQTPAVLQYGSRTTIGNQHTCDANAYRGTLADLIKLTYPGGEDMPITDADIEKLAAKLVPMIASAVWHADGAVPASAPPIANSDFGDPHNPNAGNKVWTGGYAVHAAVDSSRFMRQELATGLAELKAAIGHIAPGANASAIAQEVANLLAKRLVS